MEYWSGPAPKRARKHKSSPLDTNPDFLTVQSRILNGQISAEREAGLIVSSGEMGMEYPERAVYERLRMLVRRTGHPYRVSKYRVPGGAWCVRVQLETRKPRETQAASAVVQEPVAATAVA